MLAIILAIILVNTLAGHVSALRQLKLVPLDPSSLGMAHLGF